MRQNQPAPALGSGRDVDFEFGANGARTYAESGPRQQHLQGIQVVFQALTEGCGLFFRELGLADFNSHAAHYPQAGQTNIDPGPENP